VSRAADARLLLERIAAAYAPAALSSSLGAEDMVLTDLIARERLPIEIFTLDTGRLHAETLDLADRIRSHYGIALRVMQPDAAAVADYATRDGRDAFYASVEARKRCCEIRKVEPLKRALGGKRAWITGLRREQSAARAELRPAEFDAALRIAKFNPLSEWSGNDVWDYIRANKVPYNPLHDRGYPSIGCEPCTRAVEPGADERSGRWWWEQEGKKECGLHAKEENRDRPHFSGRDAPRAAGFAVALQNDLRFFGAEIHRAKKPETMEGQNPTGGYPVARKEA
jgi:phosphoadenosine phosphosulfate reductase